MQRKSVKDWCDEYSLRRPVYLEFERRLTDLLRDLISACGVDVVQIESRTKTVDSLREKLGRKPIADDEDVIDRIHDLVGIRVITYYAEDISVIADLLEKNLRIDMANSSNKKEDLSADQFGYLSSHFVARLGTGRMSLAEWSQYADLNVEIQVRTALQHAWAAVSHKLAYKSTGEAPSVLRRRLHRLSALFELADEEFSTLRDATHAVAKRYREEIDRGDLESPVDVSSLGEYLISVSPDLEQIKVQTGFLDLDDSERAKRDRSDLTNLLVESGFKTLLALDIWLRDKEKLFDLSSLLATAVGTARDDGVLSFDVSLDDWLSVMLIIDVEQSTMAAVEIYSPETMSVLMRLRGEWSIGRAR